MIALFEKIDTSRILKRHFLTLGDIVGKNKIWDIIYCFMSCQLSSVWHIIDMAKTM